jgi:hypothetical protein
MDEIPFENIVEEFRKSRIIMRKNSGRKTEHSTKYSVECSGKREPRDFSEIIIL